MPRLEVVPDSIGALTNLQRLNLASQHYVLSVKHINVYNVKKEYTR